MAVLAARSAAKRYFQPAKGLCGNIKGQRPWLIGICWLVLVGLVSTWTGASGPRIAVVPHDASVPLDGLAGADAADSFAGDVDWTIQNWVPPLLDLHGNEIEHAMGDYRYDGNRGGVYERHSPHTALEPLRPPVF